MKKNYRTTIINKLSYEEEMILFLYKGLYKKKYSTIDNRNNKDVLVRHANAQKANYIFDLLGIYVGDYSFGWGDTGPYSITLQKIIKDLDSKDILINDYYKKLTKDNKSVENRLFNKFQIEYINRVFDSLKPITTKENGSESLTSLAYINKNYYPNYNYKDIEKKLIELKPYLKKFNNKESWNKLKELKII